MLVHVLLYKQGNEEEGIHSLEVNDKTVVLMFEDKDDAERYCGLLEAQDFPSPTIEAVPRDEIENFCTQSGYESRYVERGFIPVSQEDRLLISPPESNLDVSQWNDIDVGEGNKINENDLSDIKKSLEDLL